MGKMSRIWKIVLGISALISLHGIGYAAVTSLSDTNYVVRATTYNQTPIPGGSSQDSGITPPASQSPAQPQSTTPECDDTGLSASFLANYTTSNIDRYNGLYNDEFDCIKGSDILVYYRYKDPSEGKHYLTYPQCKGETTAARYNIQNESCNGVLNDMDYGGVDQNFNYFPCITYDPGNRNDDNLYLAFTCDVRSTLSSCSDLINNNQDARKVFGPVDSYNTKAPIACKNTETNKVNYVGFYCKGFNLDDAPTTAECGQYESCEYDNDIGVGGDTTTVYKCTCDSDFITKEDYCARKPDYDQCLEQAYCGSDPCTIEKDTDGNSIYKCATSEWARKKTCKSLEDQYKVGYYYTSSPNCKSFAGSPAPKPDSCVEKNASGQNVLKNICLYCPNYYTDKNSADEACALVNGTASSCPFQSGANSTTGTYAGCTCPTGWKTKKDFCYENHAFGLKNTSGHEDIDRCASGFVVGVGETCQTYPANSEYNETVYESFDCPFDYKTKTEFCAEKNIENCDDYAGSGESCDVLYVQTGDEGDKKYRGIVLKCPEGVNTATTLDDCKVEGDEVSAPVADECYIPDAESGVYNESGKRYVCKCPESYGATCDDENKQRSGLKCEYDRDENGNYIAKYSNCNYVCGSPFAREYSETINDCPNVGAYPAEIRGGVTNPEMCVMASDKSERYICACPIGFETLIDWCSNKFGFNEDGSMTEEYSECIRNYTGSGTVCRYDIGNYKYADYMRLCPSDRPLYYSEEDCQFIGGELDYICNDENANQRAVCKCLSTYYDPASSEGDEDYCEIQNVTIEDDNKEIKSNDYTAEPSGITCDLEGNDNLKYRDCVAKCEAVLADAAQTGAYRYLSSEEATPTAALCKMEMGNGAKFGFKSQTYCSANNTLVYPCYCPKYFQRCSEDNQLPAENATICRSGDITYYSACSFAECQDESSTIAIEDISKEYQELVNTYGSGAEIKKCTLDGAEKWQVSCDSSTYSDPCDYPYDQPDGSNFCKYGDGSTLMKNGRPHYLDGACKILKELSECGKNVMINGEKVTSLSIASVVNSENECTSKHGPGISVQLCEYGADTGYKRAYNCYYDPTEFKYTTANCGVRHDLTGDYVIINGKKTWKECSCASAYKHHKYNCGGLLSGNACQQEITSDFMNRDSSVNEAVNEGYLKLGQSLPLYPYCECSAEYTEVCDEDGSGRYQGVGTACNGKYKSCQCVPDELPENWADNYYGCPGGKKPTGVWKDNGCGKKYYQCSVIECTWEYTEKCDAPLIPVGQACQDNQGNVGGYKACACPQEYKICPEGQVGEGEPCNLKGVSYYKSCKPQTNCTSLATETCSGPLQIGVNPCTRDNTTYYESCTCANGYDKVCGEGEVGVGNYCELNGVKYYKECTKPETNECTPGHVTACDTNQESYSPCVSTDSEGKQTIKYLCKCPSNWQACEGGSGDKCTQTNADGSKVTYWSECNASSATCTPFQEETYKVCTSAQIGEGGSCTSVTTGTGEDGSSTSTSVVKYASCRDTNNCLTNGFKYSCSGYDPAYLGESCVDENGNKLYKSCPCPSSYKTCDTQNATKGKKCTPLNSDGSFGTTVYSTCECDRTKYKYTCQAEETGNKGIVPPSGNDYCEVVETSTTTTTDLDTGETSTSTQEKRTKYYKSCECAADYKYSCSGASAGEVLPSGYENDYCQINASKFYKGCDCAPEYSVSVADCNAKTGAMVNVAEGACAVRGVVPTSEGGFKVNDTFYKGCICKPQYKLDCKSTIFQFDQTDIPYCDVNGTKLYAKCVCSRDETVVCGGGDNVAVPNDGNVCRDIEATSDGTIHESETGLATSCKCPFGYNISDSRCNDNIHIKSSQYCLLPDSSEKFYSSCSCDPSIFDTSIIGLIAADAEAYCDNKGASVSTEVSSGMRFCQNIGPIGIRSFYFPNKSLCCTPMTGYTKIFSGSYDSISDLTNKETLTAVKSKIQTQCGHWMNATITFDCAKKAYAKCINDKTAVSNYRTKTECYTLSQSLNGKSMLTAGGKVLDLTNSWASSAVDSSDVGGEFKLYEKCLCDAKKYNKDKSCIDNVYTYNWSKDGDPNLKTPGLQQGKIEAPVCFRYGHEQGQDGTNGKITTDSVKCSLNNASEKCTDSDNISHYDWRECTCSKRTYPVTDTIVRYCAGYDGTDAASCYWTFCIDKNGTHRTGTEMNVSYGTPTRGSMTVGGYKYVHCQRDSTQCTYRSDNTIQCAI